jgi:hypothetical protein
MPTPFQKKLKKFEHGRRVCTCWDCLRQVGLTPPRPVLHKHKLLYGDLGKNPYIEKAKRADR